MMPKIHSDAISEKPIIFSGPNVRAILEGRKTKTRRVITPQPNNPETFGVSPVWGHGVPCFVNGKNIPEKKRRFCIHAAFDKGGKRVDRWLSCPYGKPGDRLWVRENAWIAPPNFGDERNDPFATHTDDHGRKRVVGYSASMDCDSVRCAKDFGVKQSPSIHMPRWASRLTLEITDIRVERVQEITEEDAIAEGVAEYKVEASSDPRGMYSDCANHRFSFHQLWDSLNLKRGYGWDTNPWVWVLELAVIGNGTREIIRTILASSPRAQHEPRAGSSSNLW
jgi:hypothetical protein